MDGGPAAELVVDPASEDELLVEAAGAGGLGVEELEFPVDEGGVCWVLDGDANKTILRGPTVCDTHLATYGLDQLLRLRSGKGTRSSQHAAVPLGVLPNR